MVVRTLTNCLHEMLFALTGVSIYRYRNVDITNNDFDSA